MPLKRFEELSMNAWPALQTLLYDGWILRFANGYTKRANSANPLYFSTANIEEKIRTCEQFYRRQNLDVVFKMTSSVYPPNLDEILVKRGYRLDSPTSVQSLELAQVDKRPTGISTLSETPTADWLDDFCRLSKIDKRRRPILKQMLSRLIPQGGFISMPCRVGPVVACGMGVAQAGFIGLFDIVTGVNFRKQGYGRQLVLDLLAWGKEQGAHTAYLQVMLNNAPALRLYSKLGFKEIYQYWYRIKQ